MNERIKQLADNATHYANGVCDADPNADWYATRDQKFGELIVRECAKVIDELEDAVVIYRLGGENTGEISKSELIKQHFGVEE